MRPAEMILQWMPLVLPWLVAVSFIVFSLLAGTRVWMGWKKIQKRLRRHSPPLPMLRRFLKPLCALRDETKSAVELLTIAAQIAGADDASLFLWDAERKAARGVVGCKPLSLNVAEIQPFLGAVSASQRVVTRTMLLTSASWKAVQAEGLKYFLQFHSEACLPIATGKGRMAFLNLGSRAAGEYGREEVASLELFAPVFALSLSYGELLVELGHHKKIAQEVTKLKTQILANVSHELRTPLTSIIGLSEMMTEGIDGTVTREQIEHLEKIKNAGDRLLDTVSSMLDLSKMEANQFILNMRRVDIRKLLADILPAMSISDATHVSVELDAALPAVYGDEERIRQVFQHLLDNAAKFTKRGRIAISAERIGDMLRVCVMDTGIGISREHQRRIFDGFIQADGSMTREHQGLGLGLAICKRAVAIHSGRLWVVSRVGQGSRFYFTLPIKPVGLKYPEISACA